jgi:hypothetical protein
MGMCSASLAESTSSWVHKNLTVDKIKANEWLFMAYHAHDYYLNLDDSPENIPYKETTVNNIINCAKNAAEKNYFTLFQFAGSPNTDVARALPQELINKFLDHLESSQREDGGWNDEHGLKHWQPYFTIVILRVLRNYGRL